MRWYSGSVRRSTVALLLLGLLLTAVPVVSAQSPQPVSDEEIDVPALIRASRQKDPPPPADPQQRMIVAAPIIGSNPSAGVLLGAAAQVAVFRGDPATTRITSGIASVAFSTKKQVLANVRF